VPSFWTHLYDWRLRSVGFTGDRLDYRTVDTGPRDRFVGEYRRAGRLVGVIANGDARALVRYRRELLMEMA
jgi:hypothetical protein